MFPALGILGPRQVGKSTMLVKEWCVQKNGAYLTFDKQEILTRAKNAPEQFLLDVSDNQTKHLIIDEAQKFPQIFDSIKALIDQNRRFGCFTLSGSVEFSEKSGVKESLAGRMGITRLFPMTLKELNEATFTAPWVNFDFNKNLKSDAKSVETWLSRGGMPIFCCFSNDDERIAVINSWLEALCYRDLQQLKGGRYDSDIAFNLLRILATTSKHSS